MRTWLQAGSEFTDSYGNFGMCAVDRNCACDQEWPWSGLFDDNTLGCVGTW